MTYNLDATLGVIHAFLVAREWDRQHRQVNPDGSPVINGRHLLDVVIQMRGDGLPDNFGSDVIALKVLLFRYLEEGYMFEGEKLRDGISPWTPACTESALRKGGYLTTGEVPEPVVQQFSDPDSAPEEQMS